MTDDGLSCYNGMNSYRNREVKFIYGMAVTLIVFETKRLFVLALEMFSEWQVIRFAGGFRPVALTLMSATMGLSCALVTIRANMQVVLTRTNNHVVKLWPNRV